jgi:hypothetical protein
MLEVSHRSKAARREKAAGQSDFVVDRGPVSVEALMEKKFEQAPLSFLVPETLNFSLTSYVQDDDTKAFQRNVKRLMKLRVKFLLEKVPEERALDKQTAAMLIDDERGNLPLLQDLGGTGSMRRSVVQEDSEEQPVKSKTRGKKALADEPIEVPPARPKRKAVPVASTSAFVSKKSVPV